MKKLQNNFTTPEQSKRLLELGVPADSADCYLFDEITYNDDFVSKPEVIFYKDKFSDVQKRYNRVKRKLLPCWSGLQLIKICLRCSTLEQRQVLFFCNGDDDYYDFMSYIINVSETEIMTNHMDFSKL